MTTTHPMTTQPKQEPVCIATVNVFGYPLRARGCEADLLPDLHNHSPHGTCNKQVQRLCLHHVPKYAEPVPTEPPASPEAQHCPTCRCGRVP